MQVQEALSVYVTQMRANGRSEHTIAQARRHVGVLAEWLRESPIESLDHEKLAIFLGTPVARCRRDGSEKKATSMNAMRSSLRAFFGYLHAAGVIQTNPARLIRRALCSGPPPRGLTEDEEKRLLVVLADAPERDRLLFTLMIRTALRIGSALAIDVEDIDLDAREIRIRCSKGDREEIAFLPTDLVAPLRHWIGDRNSGPMFPGLNGLPITARHARRRFRLLLEKAGIGRVRGTHVLRHTLGLRLYRKTGDIELVRAALHHRSIVSTTAYARCGRERLMNALS